MRNPFKRKRTRFPNGIPQAEKPSYTIFVNGRKATYSHDHRLVRVEPPLHWRIPEDPIPPSEWLRRDNGREHG